MKRAAVGLLLLAGLPGFWLANRARTAAQHAALLEKAKESVLYFRFQAAFTVKDTGERIEFDYVAACSVLDPTYKDGDLFAHTNFLAPTTFIKATRDDHAIQVSTPSPCGNQLHAKLSAVTPDLFPFAVFYENAWDMSFGWGYASQDAYDSPHARMSFEGATIGPATYSDWKTWRQTAEVAFKRVGKIKSPWGYSYEQPLEVAENCDTYIRYKIWELMKPWATAEWEKRGRPEFWTYENPQTGGLLPDDWDKWVYADKQGIGLMGRITPRTKSGGAGLLSAHSSEEYSPTDVFPFMPISKSSDPPPDPDGLTFPRRLLLSDDWKGFTACFYNGTPYWDPHGGYFAPHPLGNRTVPEYINDYLIAKNSVPGVKYFYQSNKYIFELVNGSMGLFN